MYAVSSAIIGLLLLMGGCAQLGIQSTSIRVPRTQAALAYADAKELYGSIKVEIQTKCREGKLDKEACERAKAVDAQIAALDQRIRTALADEGGFDPASVEQLARLVLKFAPLMMP